LDPKGDNHLLERVARAFETSVGATCSHSWRIEAGQQQDLATFGPCRAYTQVIVGQHWGAQVVAAMCADLESIIRRQTGEDLSSRIRDIPLEAERVQAGLQHVLETQS
jgi:hypothetical protein